MLVYSNRETKRTYFELWGGSTKHPDVRKCLQSDIEADRFCPSDWIDNPEYQCFQWLVGCCADLSWGTLDNLRDLMEMVTCFDDYGTWA